jgi:pimeloyl-ACP methyl ester carboxylesterase
MTLYQHARSREALLSWHPRFLAKVGQPTHSLTLPTRWGETHVGVAGPPDGPPLVAFHGVMATSAHLLLELRPLLSHYRVYAVDVLGHSPLSADQRPPLDRYGAWASEVLDGLGLPPVPVVGVSYGGFVTLRLLAAAPERVARAALVVPGGLATGPAWAGFRDLFWPMTLYRWFPSEARLRRLTDALFTEWDDDWGGWLGDALLHFKPDFRIPPVARDGELDAFQGPVLVLGADKDLSFPGPAAIARAQALFPGRVSSHLFANTRHSPPFNDAFRQAPAGPSA